MTTTHQSANADNYRKHLLAWATREAQSKRNDWPGFPLSMLPLAAADDLHNLVATGKLEIVKVRKAKAGISRDYSYVAPA